MNTKKKTVVRIALVDFWAGCDKSEIIRCLFPNDFELIEDENNPDLLVYSCFGEKHLEYPDCKRLFYCGENIAPDFNTCDFAISTVKIQYANRSLWVPCSYFASAEVADLISAPKPDLCNRKFCSFIYSQDYLGPGARLRKDFCQSLMRAYKHVDCPGKVLHNMESEQLSSRASVFDWHRSKVSFLSNYKFNIAFENSQAPGYITEKLTDCYLANTVPIYWGSSGDVYPYPKESMICANDYASFEDLVARIKEVDENDDLYLSLLNANPFRNESSVILPDYKKEIHQFISEVIEAHVPDKGLTTWTDAHRCYTYAQEFRKPHIKLACKLKSYIIKIRSLFGFRSN